MQHDVNFNPPTWDDNTTSDWKIDSTATYSVNCAIVNIESIVFKDLKIYPNPAQEQLYIETSELIKEIVITDLSGKVIQTHHNTTLLDVSEIPAGFYPLKLKNETKQATLKIAIE